MPDIFEDPGNEYGDGPAVLPELHQLEGYHGDLQAWSVNLGMLVMKLNRVLTSTQCRQLLTVLAELPKGYLVMEKTLDAQLRDPVKARSHTKVSGAFCLFVLFGQSLESLVHSQAKADKLSFP